MTNQLSLALFDLDHTLLSGDSDYEWAQFLIGKGILDSVKHTEANNRFYAQYKNGTLDIYEFLAFQLKPLAETARTTLDQWHAEFMEERITPIITSKAKELVQKHLDADHLCALVTATNSFVTAPICRTFGIHHLIATIPEQVNGEFSGKPKGTPSFKEGKIKRVEEWLESMSLNWKSFQASFFYSDSYNDLPLLECVTHPVVVRPDERLTAHAQTHQWQMLSLDD